MKAYAVLSLLLVCNVRGYKTVESLESPQIIAENPNAIVHGEKNKLDPEDELVFDPTHEETPKESLSETQKDLANRVYFYLFTKDNPNDGQRLYLDDVATLQNSNFNFSKPTKIVTHGFLNTVYNSAVDLLRDAYLEHGDYNIVGIDWGKIAFEPYIWASERVLMVSRFSADFINFLHKQGLDLSTVTIAGHSLGAHVAGLSARYAEGNVDLVVALDPAFPNFALSKPGERVARGDADYVQVIHTNAGVLGYERAIGDVDFYPNNGNSQAGCRSNTCSHLRSFRYFAESINSDKFVAVACENYSKFKKGACKSNAKVAMGGVKPDYNVMGTYFLDTNKKYPYAQGDVA
ncbi:phospholipase A1-like [Lasioglossum baleicum]|uniref:phospholipase A1-like n=1 Tax=Lasioglossum baleicum TaxID=434251 RepID=UPI003FCD2BAE